MPQAATKPEASLLCLEAHLKVDLGNITFGEPIKLHDDDSFQTWQLALFIPGAQLSPDSASVRR
jgi:hypothetical protein